MNDSISEKIKKYRNLQNLSQEQLSQISGINISTIIKYECGFRNPKPDQLKKIANALNVSMNSFIFNDIETVSDVLSLLINLDEQTELIINGSKDSFGKCVFPVIYSEHEEKGSKDESVRTFGNCRTCG